jgi:hypothetical protein
VDGSLDLSHVAWNCFLKHVIEREIEGRTHVIGRRGRGRKQLLDDL